jgi:hypothetical protein
LIYVHMFEQPKLALSFNALTTLAFRAGRAAC